MGATNIEKALENFSNQMLNSAINGINEAVAKERKKTDYWRGKARILASKYRQCLTHGHQSAEELDEYVDKVVECHDCGADKLKDYDK